MGKGKRARKRAASVTARATDEEFFLDFRREVARYAEGVHLLGEPATQAEVDSAVGQLSVPLSAELRSFLRSWDGAELFNETWVIGGVGERARGFRLDGGGGGGGDGDGDGDGDGGGGGGGGGGGDGDGEEVWPGAALVFARGADGSRLALTGEGSVLRHDDDSGEVLVEASSFEKWLNGVIAREAMVFDRDGEYLDDVFEGDDFAAEVVVRRERKVVEQDEHAVGPRLRLGRALRDAGQPDKAREVLAVLAGEGKTPPPVVLAELAQLTAQAESWSDAALYATRALDAPGGIEPRERAAVLAAQAARWAQRGEDEAAARAFIERAQTLAPGVLAILRDAGAYELDEGRPEVARELLEAAKLLAPRDLAVLELLRRIK